jgi:flagellar biosynthesis/type III secretory pathway protein FliH
MNSDVFQNKVEFDQGYDYGFDKGFNEGFNRGFIQGYEQAVKSDWPLVMETGEVLPRTAMKEA